MYFFEDLGDLEVSVLAEVRDPMGRDRGKAGQRSSALVGIRDTVRGFLLMRPISVTCVCRFSLKITNGKCVSGTH